MPRAGTAARKRARQGLAPVKPGSKPWVHGTKLVFFKKHKEAYLAAAELSAVGAFYDEVTHGYLGVYGYNTPWKEDLPEGATVADDVDPDEDLEELTDEESDRRNAYFRKVRGKIATWYNTHYGGSVESKKKKQVTFRKIFDRPELDPPAPVKARTLNFYSRCFYYERIKGRVEARWALLSRRPVAPGAAPPAIVAVRNTVTKECWRSETQEFRDEVQAALEKEHAVALEAYKTAVSGEAPTTAEEFNVALSNAAYYLQPFADAIHERFGMNVAIMMCGPIPERGGRIEVRSVHAGMSNGLVPRVWSDTDRGGFDAAQRSFVEFTHKCFTEAECRARSLNAMAMAGEEDDPTTPEPVSATPDPVPTTSGPVSSTPETTTSGPVSSTPETGNPSAAPVAETPNVPETTAPNDVRSEERPYEEVNPLDLDMFGGGDGNDSDDLTMLGLGLGDMGGMGDLSMDGGWSFAPPQSTYWALRLHRHPKLGRALSNELAELSEGERAGQMERLRALSEEEVAEANAMARNRSFLRRLNEGMGSQEALEGLDTDADEEDDSPMWPPVTVQQPPPVTIQQPPPAVIVEPPPAVTVEPPPAVTVEPPPAVIVEPPAAITVEPPVVTTPPTRPKPRCLARLQRPECNRDAQGPSQKAGDDAGLERPETNREAQGPPLPATWEPTPPAKEKGAEESGVTLALPAMWEAQDADAWPQELRSATRAFARGMALGGEEWELCVSRLLALEKAQGFPEKGLLSAPKGGSEERPKEIPLFMKGRRRWEDQVELTSSVGPRDLVGSFSDRWWSWWGKIQPESRRMENGDLRGAEKVAAGGWTELSKMGGRNGLSLYVGSLLWWGEAAGEADDAGMLLADWRLALNEVASVLAVVPMWVPSAAVKKPAKGKASKAKPVEEPKTSTRKRKQPDTGAGKDKENAIVNKRTRRSRT